MTRRLPFACRVLSASGTRCFVILDQAELMPFGVQHIQDNALVVFVTCTGPLPAEALHVCTAGLDIVHFDIEVKPDFCRFRLGHPLEGEPRSRAHSRPESRPTCIVAMLARRVESEQFAPKTRHAGRIGTVDRHARPAVHHPPSVGAMHGIGELFVHGAHTRAGSSGARDSATASYRAARSTRSMSRGDCTSGGRAGAQSAFASTMTAISSVSEHPGASDRLSPLQNLPGSK